MTPRSAIPFQELRRLLEKVGYRHDRVDRGEIFHHSPEREIYFRRYGDREFVFARARAFGLTADRAAELVLAASEIATNSVTYGGRHGAASVWADRDCFLCEIRDRGHITDPLVGRFRPNGGTLGGYGIWLANHMCDLVQIRSTSAGTTVRLHACSNPER